MESAVTRDGAKGGEVKHNGMGGEKQLVVRGEAVYTKNLYIQDDREYPLPLWVRRDRLHVAFPVLEMSMFTDWFVSIRTEHDWILGGADG